MVSFLPKSDSGLKWRLMGLQESRTTQSQCIEFGDHLTWSRMVCPADEPSRPPVIVLHGGPGMSHDYCRTMSTLAGDGRAVIFYDQIGCGRSSVLPDAPADFWSVELFVEELRNLVAFYDFQDGFHLLGHSWGGMLAPEYALAHPDGILSMTLSNAPASMPLWVQGTDKLIAAMDETFRNDIRRHEAAGTTSAPDYLAAVDAFYRAHLCRVHPFPQDLQDSFDAHAANPLVYNTMIGPSEFTVTGTLRDWSVIDRLPQIKVPSLVIAGEFDEAQPVAWQPFVDGLPDVSSHVFAGASHSTHLECPHDYFALVGEFLRKHDPN